MNTAPPSIVSPRSGWAERLRQRIRGLGARATSGHYQLTLIASKQAIEAALLRHEEAADWDASMVISAHEVAADQPDVWQLDAYLERKPSRADRAAIAALFVGKPPAMQVQQLPDTDWLTQSQQGVAPIRAGRFHIHTPDHPALSEPGMRNFCIPASRAFGTGQHETTAGCLAMLDVMKRTGVVVRNLADIGTGTGLLAFAALHLWPRALALASDIDAVCADVVAGNAALNGVCSGAGKGALVVTVAAGMDSALIDARGPYDLIVANILAGPLIALAPDFAEALVPGGSLVLAGLLTTQEPAVRAACRRSGLRLARRETRGDWAILWLRKRGGWG